MINWIKCLTIIQIELQFGNVGSTGEGKPGVPRERPLGARTNRQQTKPTYDTEYGNRTRAILVRAEPLCPFYGHSGKMSAHAPQICDFERESITNAPLQSPNSHLLPQYFFC